MATKSTDQWWPPPPIKSKCLERVSSRYVRRRMAAALLARVGMIQSAAAKKVPRSLGPASFPRRRARSDRAPITSGPTCSVSIGLSRRCQQPTFELKGGRQLRRPYRMPSSVIARAESCAASWTPVCAILIIFFAINSVRGASRSLTLRVCNAFSYASVRRAFSN
jgi:hypothetical protein